MERNSGQETNDPSTMRENALTLRQYPQDNICQNKKQKGNGYK